MTEEVLKVAYVLERVAWKIKSTGRYWQGFWHPQTLCGFVSSINAGFWTRVCQISTWLWILVSWPRPASTLSSSPSLSFMPPTCLRRLGTGDTLPSTDIWRRTLSTSVTQSSSTLRTGAKMRTATEISSLHFWRHNRSSSMTGRPSCGPGFSVSL